MLASQPASTLVKLSILPLIPGLNMALNARNSIEKLEKKYLSSLLNG